MTGIFSAIGPPGGNCGCRLALKEAAPTGEPVILLDLNCKLLAVQAHRCSLGQERIRIIPEGVLPGIQSPSLNNIALLLDRSPIRLGVKGFKSTTPTIGKN